MNTDVSDVLCSDVSDAVAGEIQRQQARVLWRRVAKTTAEVLGSSVAYLVVA